MLRLFVLRRVGVVCGFVMPVVAFGCIGLAVLFCPGFSWTDNALSDLGVVSGVSGPVFNFGLFATGLLCFCFVVLGLFNYFRSDVVGKVGSVVFAVAAVWLMGIGVFNESFWPTHFIVSVSFFVTLPVAFLVLTGAFYLRREIKLAVFTLFSSFFAAAPWISYYITPYASNVAISEIISSTIGSLWVIVISYRMLKTAKT